MNVEKERLLITKKKLEFNHEDANLVTVEPSPKVIVNDVDGTGTSAGQACLVQSGGDKEMVKPVEGEGCNEYEMQRNLNVAKNQEKLAALGIPLLTKSVSEKAEKRELKQPNEDGGESDYLPTNEDAGESENDEADIATSKKIKKTKRQRVVQSSTRGPRTRGQAAKLVNKEAASEPLPREKNDAPVLTAKEKLQALKSVPGSMLAYNQLREREKSQIEKEIPEGESGTQQMMAESEQNPGLKINLDESNKSREAEVEAESVGTDHELIRKKEEKKQKAALGTTRTLSVPGHEYAKIRADIEKELEEKLEQKFQDMVKKLAEQNPGLKINLDESNKSREAEVEAESVGTDHE
uniref:Uncharacterized protein n=2 Tax=Daucus carota subsp. sativus TaxID=79200 RepID=A0A166CXJ7_DAUCS